MKLRVDRDSGELLEMAAAANQVNVGGERARAKRYWPQIASAILISVLLLVVIEGALRLFDVGFPTSLTVPCSLQGRPAACYNLFFPAPFFPPGMIKTPQAYAFRRRNHREPSASSCSGNPLPWEIPTRPMPSVAISM